MYIILLGPPGAGKGTQASLIAQEFGIPHVSSGDLFRENLGQGTELGLLAKSYMDKGELVPDEVTVRMVLDRIAKPDCAKGALLDGFPRTLGQARALDEALSRHGKAIDKVPLIKASVQELIRRLSGRWICRNCQTPFHMVSNPPKVAGKCDACGGEIYQRSDDTVETARNRLEVYTAQTTPLIDYYSKQGKLIEINGQQSVEEVGRELISALGVENSPTKGV